MPTLVVIHNPFKPNARDILTVEACRPLADVLVERYGDAVKIDEFHVARNGITLEAGEARELVIGAKDYISLVPRVGKGGGGKGGGGIIGIIAAVALLTMTMGAGGGMLGGLFGGGMGKLLLLGGLLMLLGKPPKIEMPTMPEFSASAFDAEPTWDTGTPVTAQGRPIPITYGTVRVRTPQVLNQHISVGEEGKQTLNLLMSGGEGPVDSISGYTINDQPYANFAEVTAYERRQMLSFEIPITSSTWSDVTYLNANTEKTVFTVEFPTGLYYKDGANAITSAYVDIRIEHRVSGGPGAGWVWEDYDTVRVTKAETMKSKPKTTLIYIHPDTEAREVRMRIEVYSPNISGSLTVCTGAVSFSYGYEGLFESRLGTNNQAVMDGFRDTFAEEYVNLELDGAWTTHQHAGNTSEGLEWTLEFPVGLAYYDDKGDATKSWVDVDIDYRLVGAVPWTTHKSAWRIERDENSNFKISTRVDGLTAGQYESRVRVNDQAGTGTRYANTVKWQILAGIVYDDFEYPGRVLVGMTAFATDKLQGGIPRVSWLQTRANVLVWDPAAGGGAGAYVSKAATNPAWICYDLIHRARTLRNINTGLDEVLVRGDAASKIDFQAFSDWADFCDETVDGEARCSCNVLVDAAGPLWEQVNRIASTGRGAIVLRGQTWSAIWDEASSPVQLFTSGNVVVDSLAGEYTSSNERANAVEVTFLNEDRNYERDTVTVYSDDYDASDTTQQPTSIIATGITSQDRAYREGAYRLRLNKYLKRICTWRADVDAVACQVGDVVLLSHDLPRWGESGRVVSCNTAMTTVTLDREVTMTPSGDYELLVRLSDDTLITKALVSPATTTTTFTVTVATAFSTAPAKYDPYAFGEVDVSAKPFRVTKIARTDDMHVEITGIEYYPEIYSESLTVPTVNYSTALPTVGGVDGIVDFDASGQAWLIISWNPPRDAYGGATVLLNGTNIGRVGPTETAIRAKIYEDGAYQVTVIGLTTAGTQLDKVQETISVAALTIPIPESVTVTEDTYILRDGTIITDIDVAYTIPEEGTWFPGATRRYPVQRFACVRASYQADEAGDYIDAGTFTSKTGLRLNGVKCRTSIKVKLEVVDKFDNAGAAGYSEVTALTGKSALPDDVTGFAGAQDQYGIALQWNMNDDVDIDVYEVRVGASWAAGTVAFSGYTERTRLNFSNSGTFSYWIKALDTSGNYSANAATVDVVVAVPATPTAAATPINGGLKIDIVHTPNVDWDHYVVERRPADGEWTTINSNLRSTTWMDTDIATLGYTTTYEYRVTAVDRNGATGTASTETTAASAKHIETLDITTDQIVAKDFRSATDAGNGTVSGYRIHSGGIEGWNGATKNFCLDGATGTLYAVNACLTGTICATAGVIGGWTVNAGSLTAGNAALCCTGVGVFGTGDDVAVVSAADGTYRFWAGNATAGSAPFSVSKAGALTATSATICGAVTATSGAIGGWTVATGCLCGGAAALYSVGCLTLGTGNDIAIISACDATYRLWVGNAAPASAPFSITKAGAIAATSGTVGGWTLGAGVLCSASGCAVFCCTGLLTGGGYASGASGWQIAADGSAEFNTLTARGAFRASVFQYQEVAAVGGQLLVANAGVVRTAVTTPGSVGTCFSLDVTDPEVGHAAQFAADDILRIQTWNGSALVSAWGTVTAVTDCATYYRYTLRLKNGTSQALPARAAVVSYGTATAGGGVMLMGAGTCSPYIDAFTTGAAPWNGYTVQTRLGRLDGIAGATGYGLYTNNGHIYGGVVRSNTFDATTGSCFGLAAGLIQLGGCCGGVSKAGLYWNGTCLNVWGGMYSTYGCIGGFIYDDRCFCAACFVCYAGGCCSSIILDSANGEVKSYLGLHQLLYMIGSPSQIIFTCCSGSGIAFYPYGGGSACTWVGCTCMRSPILCGTVAVSSPCIIGTTCVCTPVVCGTSCVSGSIFLGSTCSCAPLVYAGCTMTVGFATACPVMLVAPASGANGRRAYFDMQATFEAVADYAPRRVATIVGGFCGGAWGNEYMAFHVGCGGVANDSYLLPVERVRIYGSVLCSFVPITACCSVTSPIICATTCMYSATVCATTCASICLLCASTVTAGIVNGSTCICAPVHVSTSGLTACGVGLAANWIGATCSNGCGLVVCNGHTSGGVALYAATGSQYGTSGNFVGGSFLVNLSSTSQAFTVCNVTTGSGTAAHILASGQLVCVSSTRASKCCIAPWTIPTYFLDCFEPIRFLYCSGLNSGAPFIIGALADDMASWAPEFVRCDDAGKPVSLHEGGLAIAALSGLKIERQERREDVSDLWNCIGLLRLELDAVRGRRS